MLAGPFYVAAVLGQALTRPGFNLARHDASLLSNGRLGWIQVANFVLTGLMVVACAVGMRRALSSGVGAIDGLSYSERRWLVLGIEDATTADTRQRRIDKAVERLKAGRGQR